MNIVERIKTAIKARNNFSLSNEGVVTADWGDFVPIICQEMVPTDNFTVQSQVFVRLAPLATPTFGRIHGYINSFYVPNRILMPEDEFNNSITGGETGDYPETFPFISLAGLETIYSSLLEYGDIYAKRMRKILSYLGLGDILNDILASDIGSEKESRGISLLPILALFRIYYDYYCPLGFDPVIDAHFKECFTTKYKGWVTDSTNLDRIKYAFIYLTTCYNKDYFTTAQVNSQRGAASLAPVNLASSSLNPSLGGVPSSDNTGHTVVTFNNSRIGSNGVAGASISSGNAGQSTNVVGQVSGHSLNLAQKVQSFLERNNINPRPFEQMLARFGVKVSNEKLQRAQYLGGNDMWIQVSDVTSTSQTDGASLGEMAGKGIGLGKKNIQCSADEYGFFISIFHFVPETQGLVDGLSKMWRRETKFDYWQPEVEDTGYEPVKIIQLNRHFFTNVLANATTNKDSVFGYVPKYADYKFANPILGGDFVLGNGILSADVMSSMNLFRRIGLDDVLTSTTVSGYDNPILNESFLTLVGFANGQNNFNRIFQNTEPDFDHFFINFQFSIGANRPMLGYAESGLEFTEQEKSNGKVAVAYGGMRL